MLHSEAYEKETRTLHGVVVGIESYKIGDRFYCHLSNVDPGATIARTQGTTREEAIQIALARANERLTTTSR